MALKPGKPICLAVTDGKPVVILPGFPTSAIFTFHEFVAPVIRAFAGLPVERRRTVTATLPMRVNSERGRTEYLLVGLVQGAAGLAAYPMGKGSGSVTTFSGADGFITIDQHTEILDAGSAVAGAAPRSQQLEPADLVIIGSHCVGLDLLIGQADAPGHPREGALRRQHGRPRGGEARRMRHRRAFTCWIRRPASTTDRC